MATNFMKTALQAAVVAGLGAGSFGAQAALQSVPGEAQLIPLVYTSGPVADLGAELWDTAITVEMPNSLGKDTVIQITAAQTTPTSTPSVESTGQPTNGKDDDGYPGVKLHWYFLDEQSNHVINGGFVPSLDDIVTWRASESIPAGRTGYVVIVNESAINGGKALDAFYADAHLIHLNPSLSAEVAHPQVTTIPTYAMDDGVDTTTYPTPFNNVIESQQFTTAPKFPVASPIHSGIRTGASAYQNNIRLFDMALVDREHFDNLLVIWNDRNNGLTQQAVEFDAEEQSCSTTINLPQQLNILYVPSFEHVNNPEPYYASHVPFVDNYSVSNAVSTFKPWSPLCMTIAHNNENEIIEDSDSGFLKIYVNEIPQSAAPNVNNGAYASMAAFTLPILDTDAAVEDGMPVVTLPSILAKDRGFFDAK